ncbi:MAG: iron ABC transporter permease [Brachymonas sp.]|nr:iron ABC transporter permease [Brachymonas sp.]
MTLAATTPGKEMPARPRNTPTRLWWLLGCAPLAILASLLIGPRHSLSVMESAQLLWHSITDAAQVDAMLLDIMRNVRLPRTVVGFLVGAALSASGVALQAIARNPLVAPDIAGISSGAAFGAALALSTSWLPVQGTAFAFGVAASIATYYLGRIRRRLSTVGLVLSGVVVGSIFTALLSVLQAFTDPLSLQSIVLWTMGNLHHASWQGAQSLALPVLVSFALLWHMRWRLNVLALGDEEALAVGIDPARNKLWVLMAAVLAASSAVAVAGIIALVGLIVPHTVRLWLGADHQRLVPGCMLAGGSFLVLVDALARSSAPVELPIGIFTTLVGGPVLLFFLRAGKLRQRED